jgi:RNA polymerase sigma-70 factor (ECF subfamily)
VVNSPSTSSASTVDPSQARWFNEEVYAHDASLKNYLRHSFPAVRDVDDVAQESYLRVWRRQMVRPITQVTGSVRASVKSFLFQVARRLALDTLRRERASPIESAADALGLAVMDAGADTRDTVCTNQEFEFLLEAIATLPARCREVVVLRKLHGLSPAETAARLGISEETVHVQARRGLQRTQEFLRGRGVIRPSLS